MRRAWEEVLAYVADNAYNPRKGYRLKDLSDAEQLAWTALEMDELVRSPDSLDEMADVLACLFHYMMRKGWTPEMIDAEVCRKLALRFPETAAKLERQRQGGAAAIQLLGQMVEEGASYAEDS